MAAFVGGELRGVDAVSADGRIALNVVSNQESGETVSFRVWDASACTVYPIRQTVPFDRETVVQKQGGGPIDLEAVDVSRATSIALNEGWTWVSMNRDLGADTTLSEVFGPLSVQNGALVKGQAEFSQFEEGQWLGSLDGVHPGATYFVKTEAANELIVEGDTLDYANTSVALEAGWNWVGYLPPRPMELDEALSSLSPQAGALVKSQSGFGVWTDTDGNGSGDAWLGSLEAMRPGEGYLMKMPAAAELTYPVPPSETASAPLLASRQTLSKETGAAASPDSGSVVADSLENEPDWSVEPNRYRYNASITARLEADGETLQSERSMLGVFRGDTLRGGAHLEHDADLGAWRVYLLAYSNETDAREMSLKVYDAERDTVLATDQQITFRPDAVVGTPTDPLVVTAKTKTGIETLPGVPDEVTLKPNFPNPAHQATTIRYGLPRAGTARLEVYDALGRRVRVLAAKRQPAGWHTVRLQTERLASGVYFYRLRAEGTVRTRRLVVVR